MHMGFRSIVLVSAFSLFLLGGCEFEGQASRHMEEQPVTVDRGGVDHANIELNMRAGELDIRGGADGLVDGKFEYNVPAWKPRVRSSVVGSHATVTIQQPEHVMGMGHTRNIWNLQLNDKVLTDLIVHCGAGRASLSLGDLTLRDLDIQMGAGQVDVDLRGHPTHDYDVNISGGVGQATIHLPEGVGIRAEAHGGLGSITVTGLEKEGNHWENSLYDKASINVRVKVQGGIGEIRIIA